MLVFSQRTTRPTYARYSDILPRTNDYKHPFHSLIHRLLQREGILKDHCFDFVQKLTVMPPTTMFPAWSLSTSS